MNLELVCTGCGAALPLADAAYRCRRCGEPLEVMGFQHPEIHEGMWSKQTLLERYEEFLPRFGSCRELSMGEGFTPLVNAPTLAEEVGVRCLLIKNETANPTWSFKDRGTLLAMAEALSRGYRAVGVVSTGNMAASVAAYGAHAGVSVLVLVGADTPDEKLPPISVYGCTVVKVRGDYGDLYYHSLSLDGIRFLNSDVPARVEGSKTIAYEICEQLGFVAPDWVIVPTSSGGNLRGIAKGFSEMRAAGFTQTAPRIVCAQAQGCAPICNAWDRGDAAITPVPMPHTIAHAISNPSPPSGNAVLRMLRESAGLCVSVSDDALLDAQLRMASTGVFGQPAAAVPLAAACVLAQKGVLQSDDSVVCIATGGGLKFTRAIEDRVPRSRESDEAVRPTVTLRVAGVVKRPRAPAARIPPDRKQPLGRPPARPRHPRIRRRPRLERRTRPALPPPLRRRPHPPSHRLGHAPVARRRIPPHRHPTRLRRQRIHHRHRPQPRRL